MNMIYDINKYEGWSNIIALVSALVFLIVCFGNIFDFETGNLIYGCIVMILCAIWYQLKANKEQE